MGVTTRRSGRLAAKGSGSAAPSAPRTPIRKAVRKGVSKAKALAAKATVKAAKLSPKVKAKSNLGPFPHLELLDHDGNTVNTATVANQTAFVVFLYPKANTPGCTTQACGFRDNFDEFSQLGYQVFGLSYDSPRSQLNWKNKRSLTYSLWCDTPAIGLIKALGAHKERKSVKRSHFVVAKGGTIVDRHIQISPRNSIDRALEFARANPADELGGIENAKENADTMEVEKPDKGQPAEGATEKEKPDLEMTDAATEEKAAEPAKKFQAVKTAEATVEMTDKPSEEKPDKAAGEMTDKPSEETPDKAAEKVTDKPSEEKSEKALEAAQKVPEVADKAAKKSGEKGVENTGKAPETVKSSADKSGTTESGSKEVPQKSDPTGQDKMTEEAKPAESTELKTDGVGKTEDEPTVKADVESVKEVSKPSATAKDEIDASTNKASAPPTESAAVVSMASG